MDLDLSNTGALYTRVPLRAFEVFYLDMENTSITNKHLRQITMNSGGIVDLNNSRCPLLSDDCLFHSKEELSELTHLDISYNDNFTILGFSCACTFEDIQHIKALGLQLSPKECHYLLSTFSSVERRVCRIECDEDGEYPVEMYRKFRAELSFH